MELEVLTLFRFTLTVGCTGAILAFASGCEVEHDKQLARQAVHQFHGRVNSGAFRDVYTEADSELRTASSESAFVDFLAGIRDNLGTVERSANISSMSLVATGRGTRVSMIQRTEFAKGLAEERFVWCIRDGHARLCSYHIGSPDGDGGAKPPKEPEADAVP